MCLCQLDYEGMYIMEELVGFEPTHDFSPNKVATCPLIAAWVKLRIYGAEDRSRTYNLHITSVLHCQLCYFGMEESTRLELAKP